MAALSGIERGSCGMFLAMLSLLGWILFVVVTAFLPTISPVASAYLGGFTWPALFTVLFVGIRSVLTLIAPSGGAPSAIVISLVGVVAVLIIGYVLGEVVALLYNIIAARGGGGVRIELSEQNSSLYYIGVGSYARVIAIITLMIDILVVLTLGIIGLLLVSYAGLAKLSVVEIGLEAALAAAVIALLDGLIFAFAFNVATGVIGGIKVEIKNTNDGFFALKYVEPLRFSVIFALGTALSLVATLGVGSLPYHNLLPAAVFGAALSLNSGTAFNLIALGTVYACLAALVLAVAYNNGLSKIAIVKVSLEGLTEATAPANEQATEFEMAHTLNEEVAKDSASKSGASLYSKLGNLLWIIIVIAVIVATIAYIRAANLQFANNSKTLFTSTIAGSSGGGISTYSPAFPSAQSAGADLGLQNLSSDPVQGPVFNEIQGTPSGPHSDTQWIESYTANGTVVAQIDIEHSMNNQNLELAYGSLSSMCYGCAQATYNGISYVYTASASEGDTSIGYVYNDTWYFHISVIGASKVNASQVSTLTQDFLYLNP